MFHVFEYSRYHVVSPCCPTSFSLIFELIFPADNYRFDLLTVPTFVWKIIYRTAVIRFWSSPDMEPMRHFLSSSNGLGYSYVPSAGGKLQDAANPANPDVSQIHLPLPNFTCHRSIVDWSDVSSILPRDKWTSDSYRLDLTMKASGGKPSPISLSFIECIH